MRASIRTALAYPLLLATVGTGAVALLVLRVWFAVPLLPTQ